MTTNDAVEQLHALPVMTHKRSLHCAYEQLSKPSQLFTVEVVAKAPEIVPNEPGLYGWWFSEAPGRAPLNGAREHQGFYWLYVGIAGGRPGSRRTLRRRLLNHVRGPARSSTLRRTLAALLRDELALELSRSPAGKLILDADGEARLTAWMNVHMRVAWAVNADPAALEGQLISSDLALPLNIQGSKLPFAAELRILRRDAPTRVTPLD